MWKKQESCVNLMKNKNIPLAKPLIGSKEKRAVQRVLNSGNLAQGPVVAAFEKNFSRFVSDRDCVAVNSGTSGLVTAVMSLGIGQGDEVIVPSFTFAASANSIALSGAKPVFIDIDPDYYSLSEQLLEAAINSKTKAIMPVHLHGLMCDMRQIKKISKKFNLKIIEDASQAHGSKYYKTSPGFYSDIATFSFYPTKNLGAIGEGGAVITNKKSIFRKIAALRTWAENKNSFFDIGYNYRMTDIQGAIGVVQLAKLDKFIDERDQWAQYYKEQLKDIPWLRTPETPNGYKHGWQSYVTYIDESCAPMKRNDIMEFLQQRGISTRPGTHAVHMLDVYAKMYSIKPQDFPNAFNADQYSMSIPMHNKMSSEDFEYIVHILKSIK